MTRAGLAALVRAALELGGEVARRGLDRLLGRDAAFAEGRDIALCAAAMKAHDMGHPDVRRAINAMMPDGSPFIPLDDPRHPKHRSSWPTGEEWDARRDAADGHFRRTDEIR